MPPKQTSPTEHRGKGRPRAFDRDQALHRALEVFWRRGYEPASVAELCQAMGINPPSLYATFGNKSSLFLEAVRITREPTGTLPQNAFWPNPICTVPSETFSASPPKSSCRRIRRAAVWLF